MGISLCWYVFWVTAWGKCYPPKNVIARNTKWMLHPFWKIKTIRILYLQEHYVQRMCVATDHSKHLDRLFMVAGELAEGWCKDFVLQSKVHCPWTDSLLIRRCLQVQWELWQSHPLPWHTKCNVRTREAEFCKLIRSLYETSHEKSETKCNNRVTVTYGNAIVGFYCIR